MAWKNEAEAPRADQGDGRRVLSRLQGRKRPPIRRVTASPTPPASLTRRKMCAPTDATLDFWLTTGRFADRFEKEFAKWIGVKFAHLVNSGSSANLIAFMALTAPELGDRQIKKGDEIITVACGFPHHRDPGHPVRRGARVCGCDRAPVQHRRHQASRPPSPPRRRLS